jgi:hypothetical protein
MTKTTGHVEISQGCHFRKIKKINANKYTKIGVGGVGVYGVYERGLAKLCFHDY